MKWKTKWEQFLLKETTDRKRLEKLAQLDPTDPALNKELALASQRSGYQVGTDLPFGEFFKAVQRLFPRWSFSLSKNVEDSIIGKFSDETETTARIRIQPKATWWMATIRIHDDDQVLLEKESIEGETLRELLHKMEKEFLTIFKEFFFNPEDEEFEGRGPGEFGYKHPDFED